MTMLNLGANAPHNSPTLTSPLGCVKRLFGRKRLETKAFGASPPRDQTRLVVFAAHCMNRASIGL